MCRDGRLMFKEKLKLLKGELRKWNKEVFGDVDLSIEKIVEEMNILDGVAASNSVVDANKRKELTVQFWQQLHRKESLIRQKSRTKRVLEGDANTRYFHACLGARRRRNQLSALRVGSSWVDGVDEVKDEIKCHFERIFSEVTYSRPNLDGVFFNMISADDNAFLTEPFSLEESRMRYGVVTVIRVPGSTDLISIFIKNSGSC